MSNRSRIAVMLAAAAVSASAWAVGPNPPSPVSVTSYYSDAARTQLVGVSMYGDCPGANGQLIGQYGPYSDSTTVLCDDVGNVPMPF